ncbi:MAG: caspase family protein, partial [Muribaculum sp.]|nr:caspase family protein [Muribaculum sp.]
MRFRIIRNIIIATVCCLSCLTTWGATRHGLVIGLGEYQDKAWSKIHGDRDVPIVKDMLTKCGYTDIVTLVNKQATKAGITSAFSQLAERCKKGDVVYIHFSGHGQQITDVNGDEDDGWDEAWIPYDAMYAYSNSYKGEKHLIDDEIAMWMGKIKSKIGATGNLLLVVDACHSGDSSRDDIEDDEIYIRGAEKDFIIPLKKKPSKIAKTKENWLTLTACRD